MLKSCTKCGLAKEHAQGARYCRECWAAYMRARRAKAAEAAGREPGQQRRPKRIADLSQVPVPAEATGSLLQTFQDPKLRVAALMAAHQVTLEEYDALVRELRGLAVAARKAGMVVDSREIAKELRQVTKARGDYLQRMSERVELWQGFQDPDPEAAPITFVLHELPPVGLVKEMDPGVAKVLADALERDGGGRP